MFDSRIRLQQFPTTQDYKSRRIEVRPKNLFCIHGKSDFPFFIKIDFLFRNERKKQKGKFHSKWINILICWESERKRELKRKISKIFTLIYVPLCSFLDLVITLVRLILIHSQYDVKKTLYSINNNTNRETQRRRNAY